ncbi:MAG: hypothetical protein EOO38_07860 [Cytophagaceae bacterium]|nr:MAG: hypothetical protein EOO38_07860 [Cytophagaceae bacterium]
MQLISLLLSRGGRRWVFTFVASFAWLGMCQSAAAAVSCTTSAQSSIVIYNGSAISNVPVVTRLDCAGLPVNEPGSQYNLVTMCSTSDASTATGTGGNTVTPWRIARSAANNELKYQLASKFAGGSGSVPSGDLVQGGLWLGGTNFGTSQSGTVVSATISNASNGPQTPLLNVPAAQNVPAGDYVSMVSITLDIRLVKSNFQGDCTEGISVGMVVLNIPVLIRVGGATCSITYAAPLPLGLIEETSGTVTSNSGNAGPGGFHLTCASGTSWTATLSDGNNALGTGSDRRRLANGGSYLNYQIINYDGTQFDSATGVGTGYDQIVKFGARIPPQTPASLTQGVYTDTVIISLRY